MDVFSRFDSTYVKLSTNSVYSWYDLSSSTTDPKIPRDTRKSNITFQICPGWNIKGLHGILNFGNFWTKRYCKPFCLELLHPLGNTGSILVYFILWCVYNTFWGNTQFILHSPYHLCLLFFRIAVNVSVVLT